MTPSSFTATCRRALAGIAVLLALCAVGAARAQDYAALVAAADRSEADRQADAKRDPVKLLGFMAPQPGWKVLDMAAGAGYSTELLARAVAPNGKVYAQHYKPSDKFAARMSSPAMANVEDLVTPFDEVSRPALHDLDLVAFLFGYHDTTFLGVNRARMDKELFDALKPGGILVVADHAARAEDGAGVGKTLHRISEATLRAEIEAAGFTFVAAADFLRHPEDARTDIVFKNPTPVDEFVLKFRKP
ncbi:MAG: class I SAM-dependent methyltransferase [Xanthobacteraceae bacterium]